VAPDVLVGICTEKSLEMVIGVLGIQKAGGAYVPLDPQAPRDRLNIVLDDLQLSVLVTQPHLEGRFAGCPFRVVALDAVAEDDSPGENLVSGVTADHLAYIIYTSGSTGIPKGVVVKHRPAINLIEWVNRTFAVGPSDRVLFVNSLGFDLSVYDIFGLLAAGGSVRVASGEELRDPRRLLEILYTEPITFWNSAPATLSQLVPFGNGLPAGGSSRLRLAFLSGDWIPLSMPDWIRTAFPGTRVISLGGATEATVWSNFYEVGALDAQWVSIPYGKPIQNARYHVLDAHLQPVPVGVAGDLYIGGECLAEGYFKRPELNAQKFIADPYGRPGDRLYRTGDLARYWADGNLEFLGRVDHQVKVRGYRIELGEIETVLSSREDIQEVLVVAGPDPAGGKRLIAYVVAKAGCTPSTQALRNALKDKLPEYMIPAAFVWLPAFPLNASGKIDRKALPEPLATPERVGTYLAPRTPIEILLVQIWQEALHMEKVGVNDNFFEMGGHSLLAGRVISLIQQITGRLLPLSALFANPTVAQLAALLKEDSLLDQVWDTLVPIRKTGSRPPLYCIHPVSGDVEYAYKLIPYLPADQPVYGILARGINGVDAPYPTVEEAAAAYAEQIQARQPEGPLHLAGYSYGGLVAYEIARLLTQRGRKVENLILFDTYPPNVKYRYKHYGLQYVLLSFLCLITSLSNLRDFFRNQYWRSLQRRGKSVVKMIACRAGVYQYPAHPFWTDPEEDTALRDQIRLRLFRVLGKAVHRYRLNPYSGKVVFIRAMEGPARYLSHSDFGWKKNVSGPVAVHNVPGVDHLKIFAHDRYVRAVADAMNLHLGGGVARKTELQKTHATLHG
jgi:amino acid adenylation domain-containing protein